MEPRVDGAPHLLQMWGFGVERHGGNRLKHPTTPGLFGQSPQPVLFFAPSIAIRSQRHRLRRRHNGGSCSTASPPASAPIYASPDCDECSVASPRTSRSCEYCDRNIAAAKTSKCPHIFPFWRIYALVYCQLQRLHSPEQGPSRRFGDEKVYMLRHYHKAIHSQREFLPRLLQTLKKDVASL